MNIIEITQGSPVESTELMYQWNQWNQFANISKSLFWLEV